MEEHYDKRAIDLVTKLIIEGDKGKIPGFLDAETDGRLVTIYIDYNFFNQFIDWLRGSRILVLSQLRPISLSPGGVAVMNLGYVGSVPVRAVLIYMPFTLTPENLGRVLRQRKITEFFPREVGRAIIETAVSALPKSTAAAVLSAVLAAEPAGGYPQITHDGKVYLVLPEEYRGRPGVETITVDGKTLPVMPYDRYIQMKCVSDPEACKVYAKFLDEKGIHLRPSVDINSLKNLSDPPEDVIPMMQLFGEFMDNLTNTVLNIAVGSMLYIKKMAMDIAMYVDPDGFERNLSLYIDDYVKPLAGGYLALSPRSWASQRLNRVRLAHRLGPLTLRIEGPGYGASTDIARDIMNRVREMERQGLPPKERLKYIQQELAKLPPDLRGNVMKQLIQLPKRDAFPETDYRYHPGTSTSVTDAIDYVKSHPEITKGEIESALKDKKPPNPLDPIASFIGGAFNTLRDLVNAGWTAFRNAINFMFGYNAAVYSATQGKADEKKLEELSSHVYNEISRLQRIGEHLKKASAETGDSTIHSHVNNLTDNMSSWILKNLQRWKSYEDGFLHRYLTAMNTWVNTAKNKESAAAGLRSSLNFNLSYKDALSTISLENLDKYSRRILEELRRVT